MWWHRNIWRPTVSVFILLLFVLFMAGFGHDVRWDFFKRRRISCCVAFFHRLCSIHAGGGEVQAEESKMNEESNSDVHVLLQESEDLHSRELPVNTFLHGAFFSIYINRDFTVKALDHSFATSQKSSSQKRSLLKFPVYSPKFVPFHVPEAMPPAPPMPTSPLESSVELPPVLSPTVPLVSAASPSPEPLAHSRREAYLPQGPDFIPTPGSKVPSQSPSMELHGPLSSSPSLSLNAPASSAIGSPVMVPMVPMRSPPSTSSTSVKPPAFSSVPNLPSSSAPVLPPYIFSGGTPESSVINRSPQSLPLQSPGPSFHPSTPLISKSPLSTSIPPQISVSSPSSFSAPLSVLASPKAASPKVYSPSISPVMVQGLASQYSPPPAIHRPPAPASVIDPSNAPFTVGTFPVSGSPNFHPFLESPSPIINPSKVKSPHFVVAAPLPVFNFPAYVPSVPPVHYSHGSSRHPSPSHSLSPSVLGTPPWQAQPPSTSTHLPLNAPLMAPPIFLGPSLPPRRGHHNVEIFPPAPNPSSVGISPKSSGPVPSHNHRNRHSRAPIHIPPGPMPSAAPLSHVTNPPMALPPPPPNHDCASVSCSAPYTETPLGSPCGCVIPIQVELELGLALYALFPLISVLAEEVAQETLLLQSEVKIMGANADSRDQDKSIVDIDLVPLGETFDNLTALLIFQKFWSHEVKINETLFGNYTVIYVHYPGLPPSPPSAYYGGTIIGGSPGSDGDTSVQPFGVNIKKRGDKMGSGTIAMIALATAIAVVICLGLIWFMVLKGSYHKKLSPQLEPALTSSITKRIGGGYMISSDMPSSTSMSLASNMATYTGSARTFSFAELERATDRFKPQNIVGEGGFGRVYQGVLDDGTKVAVKILTRDDQQGGREFMAEVEMLSRLHHRNLVHLVGICTEEHARCLVYELIPNGSVESHLHGIDKEASPLDWDARVKIALGAARGLAYLHEDSNPRVIHRDFKGSNILLEDDFTPKVSDFGLAKAAPDESSEHISTRVMGTFGYVAPEYAMTGHLLVKSDVYSYGVVLLELLSGRKPVDMSQPPGQENLVTWSRPLLTSKEGLEMLVDPALGNNFPFDNMARVAAIASMCVQPEVSHRPFMGEVVQALKLVCNDSDASNGIGSVNGSQRTESPFHNSVANIRQAWEGPGTHYAPDSTSFISIDYDSGPIYGGDSDTVRPVSASALSSNSERFIRQPSGSFRRHSTSGPLNTNRSKAAWYKIRGIERGSLSEHALTSRFGTQLDRDFYELWP